MFGYCYTQLTDVYQEKNGSCSSTGSPKADLRGISAAQRRRNHEAGQPG